MAILQDNAGKGGTFHLFDMEGQALPPRGTYAATIIAIADRFGVERRKFDDPTQTEKVDLTAFLFGFRDKTGAPFMIDSRPMKISGNERSALYAFLKSILGEAPKMGWDYMELKGRKVLITVDHSQGKTGQTFASIAAVSPMPEGYGVAPAAPTPTPVPTPAANAAPVQPKPAARPAPVPAPVEDEGPLPF